MKPDEPVAGLPAKPSAQPALTLIANSVVLDGSRPTPLYRQLQIGLRQLLVEDALPADEAIPGERELAAGLGVSRVTVRKAIRALVDKGLLEQRQGSGTFVTARLEQPLSRLTGFSEDIRARGQEPGLTWLDRSVGVATPEEAMALNLSPGAEVSRLYRIRSADDKPLALEQATLPRHVLSDPGIVEHSLYAVLSKLGLRPSRALQRLRAELLGMEHARLLQVPPGSAALYIERRGFLSDGTPVEFTRSHYRGDAYDFVAELSIEGA